MSRAGLPPLEAHILQPINVSHYYVIAVVRSINPLQRD